MVVVSILFSTQLNATEGCKLSNEYGKLRVETYNEMTRAFKECSKSAGDAVYWKALASCVSEGRGQNVGGGCGHLISYGQYPIETANTTHCQVFKKSHQEIQDVVDAIVEEKGIAKCAEK